MLVPLALSVLATLGAHLEQAEGVADNEREEILARVVEAAGRVGIGPATSIARPAAAIRGRRASKGRARMPIRCCWRGARGRDADRARARAGVTGSERPRARPPSRADLREGVDRRAPIEETYGEALWGVDGTLARLAQWPGSGATLSDLFRSDDVGRLLASSHGAKGLLAMTSGAITGPTIDALLGLGASVEAYQFDAADNWTHATLNGVTTAPVVGADERYTQFGGNVSADPEGNTLGLPDGATYGYDGLGRIVTARTARGDSYAFAYDALGRLARYVGHVLRARVGSVTTLQIPGDGTAPIAVAQGAAIA
jgi:YD repeat-containing protein